MSDEPRDPTDAEVVTLDTTRPRPTRSIPRNERSNTAATPPDPDLAARRPIGRPTVMNTEVSAAITSAISLGSPLRHAAAFAGVSEQTVRNWQRRGTHALQNIGINPDEDEYDADDALGMIHPDDHPYVKFLWALRQARATGVLANLQKIRDAKDWRSAAFILERTEHEFRPPRMEVTGADGGPIEIDARALVLQALDRRRAAATVEAEAIGETTSATPTKRAAKKAAPRKSKGKPS